MRDLISFAEAERLGAIMLASDLQDMAAYAERARVYSLARRLEAAARTVAAKAELIDRLLPSDASEDTQPIIVMSSNEICSRCLGTGEVPICRS